jgi:hypothetical protein
MSYPDNTVFGRTFENWLEELHDLPTYKGLGYGNEGDDAWNDFWLMAYSPAEALAEDTSYGA